MKKLLALLLFGALLAPAATAAGPVADSFPDPHCAACV
jgi:hypothetical protein